MSGRRPVATLDKRSHRRGRVWGWTRKWVCAAKGAVFAQPAGHHWQAPQNCSAGFRQVGSAPEGSTISRIQHQLAVQPAASCASWQYSQPYAARFCPATFTIHPFTCSLSPFHSSLQISVTCMGLAGSRPAQPPAVRSSDAALTPLLAVPAADERAAEGPPRFRHSHSGQHSCDAPGVDRC